MVLSGGGGTAVVGGFVMAKKLLCGAAVCVAATTWLVWPVGDALPRGEAPPEPAAAAAAPTLGAPVSGVPGTAPSRRAAPRGPVVPAGVPQGDRSRDLFGVVVAPDGSPVAGALVETIFPGRLRSQRELVEDRPGPTASTAPDGTFAIRLQPRDRVSLRVTALPWAQAFVPLCPAGECVRLVLAEPGTLEVETVDEAGAPVAGVPVLLTSFEPARGPLNQRAGRTGHDGRCLFAGLVAGLATVSCRPPEHVLEERGVRVPRGGFQTERIVLRAGRTVRGRVLDDETREPIAGAHVGDPGRHVRTDEQGRFTIRGWKDDVWRNALAAWTDGRARVRLEVPLSGDLEFRLPAGRTLEGRVLAADGASVADAVVRAVTRYDAVSTKSGPDGRFRLTGLVDPTQEPVVGYDVIVEAEGHGRVSLPFPGMRPDLGEIRLPVGRSIAGVVLDADGRPAQGVSVSLVGRINEVGRTDDLGRFRFGDLAPGDHRLWTDRVQVVVTLPSGRDVTDLVLRPPEGKRLNVLAVDAEGRPQAGVRLSLRGVPWAAPSEATDAAGRASFCGLPGGEVILFVDDGPNADGISYAPEEVGRAVPAGQEVRVVVRTGAELSGRCEDRDGKPVPEVPVAAFRVSDDRSVVTGRADGEGRFTLVVPPGERVHLSAADQQPGPVFWRGELRDVGAPAEHLVLPMRRLALDRSLTVQVHDPDGKPVWTAAVTAQSWTGGRSGRTGKRGTITLEDLPDDHVTVVVSSDAQTVVDEDAIPPAGVRVLPEGQTITLSFRRGVPVTGVVLDGSERPARSVAVTLTTPDGVQVGGVTDAAGRFRIAGLSGQLHRLAAEGTVLERVRPEDGVVLVRLAK
jgi:hypothetical protein